MSLLKQIIQIKYEFETFLNLEKLRGIDLINHI